MFHSIHKLIELLKTEYNTRVTVGHRWMVWNDSHWVVYERLPYQKYTRELITTNNLSAAVNMLREGE